MGQKYFLLKTGNSLSIVHATNFRVVRITYRMLRQNCVHSITNFIFWRGTNLMWKIDVRVKTKLRTLDELFFFFLVREQI